MFNLHYRTGREHLIQPTSNMMLLHVAISLPSLSLLPPSLGQYREAEHQLEFLNEIQKTTAKTAVSSLSLSFSLSLSPSPLPLTLPFPLSLSPSPLHPHVHVPQEVLYLNAISDQHKGADGDHILSLVNETVKKHFSTVKVFYMYMHTYNLPCIRCMYIVLVLFWYYYVSFISSVPSKYFELGPN